MDAEFKIHHVQVDPKLALCRTNDVSTMVFKKLSRSDKIQERGSFNLPESKREDLWGKHEAKTELTPKSLKQIQITTEIIQQQSNISKDIVVLRMQDIDSEHEWTFSSREQDDHWSSDDDE